MQKSYIEKLRDPRWQKKKSEILTRDKFTCQMCFGKDVTLNVHHLEYNGDPWDTPDEQLLTTCENCHRRAEEILKAVRRLIPYHTGVFEMVCELIPKDDGLEIYTTLENLRNENYFFALHAINSLLNATENYQFKWGFQRGSETERAKK